MKSVEWKTYRTRFLVQAKQLNSALSFVDPLGRTHCGRRGDYLVESSDGVISITPRQIFEDIYVAMSPDEIQADEKLEEKKSVEGKLLEASNRDGGDGATKFEAAYLEKKRAAPARIARGARAEKLCACPTTQLNIEPLDIEEVEFSPIVRRPATSSRDLRRDDSTRVRRKLPQSTGERAPTPRLGLM